MTFWHFWTLFLPNSLQQLASNIGKHLVFCKGVFMTININVVMSETVLPVSTVGKIQQKTLETFGQWPCLWQCKTTQAILTGGWDIVCISETGSGKILMFWISLLFQTNRIQVIITPLNILGEQNQTQLKKFIFSAVVITASSATAQNFQLCY